MEELAGVTDETVEVVPFAKLKPNGELLALHETTDGVCVVLVHLDLILMAPKHFSGTGGGDGFTLDGVGSVGMGNRASCSMRSSTPRPSGLRGRRQL